MKSLLPAHVTVLVTGKQKCSFPEDSVRWIRGAFSHQSGQVERSPHMLTEKKKKKAHNLSNWH